MADGGAVADGRGGVAADSDVMTIYGWAEVTFLKGNGQ